MKTPPYERIVQWLSGPFSAAVGLVATKAVTHMSWLGQAGLQKSSVAHGIVEGSVFVATAGVTFAAHSKWFGNLAKWWTASGLTEPATGDEPASPPPTDTTGESTEEILRDQLRAAGKEPIA